MKSIPGHHYAARVPAVSRPLRPPERGIDVADRRPSARQRRAQTAKATKSKLHTHAWPSRSRTRSMPNGYDKRPSSDPRLKRIQTVGAIERRAGIAMPVLKQRPRGREREKGYAHGGQQDQEQQRDRLLGARRLERIGRQHGHAAPDNGGGKDDDRRGEQRQMHSGLPAQFARSGEVMRVGIPREQRHLKEYLTCSPDRRGSAKPRQQALGADQFQLKQQEGG